MRMRKSEKYPEAIKKFVVATDGTYLGRVKERSSQEYREKDGSECNPAKNKIPWGDACQEC